MKKSSFLLLTILLVVFPASAFIQPSFDGPNFKYSIKGVNHDLKDGSKISEFNELRIETGDKDLVIESFQITLARGNRAIEVTDVNGSIFDLRKYIRKARSGDRIVIEIKKLSDGTNAHSVFALKVN